MGIDPGNHLALLDGGIEIGVEGLDPSRDLAADLDRHQGGEGAGGGDLGDDAAAIHFRRFVGQIRLLAAQAEPENGGQGQPRGDEKEGPEFAPRARRFNFFHRSDSNPRNYGTERCGTR